MDIRCTSAAVSVFCDSSSLNNNDEFSQKLFNSFSKDGFIIRYININSISINTGKDANTPNVTIIKRPQLYNSSTSETITVLPERINYLVNLNNKVVIEENENVKFESVILEIDRALTFIKRILEMLEKNCSRIALNTNYIVDKVILDSLEHFNKYYNNEKFTEYNSRCVTETRLNKDVINVISEIVYNQLGVDIGPSGDTTKVDGVVFHNDINTTQHDLRERFDDTDIATIIKEMQIINSEVYNGFIKEGNDD